MDYNELLEKYNLLFKKNSRLRENKQVAFGETVLEVSDLSNDTEFDGISFTLKKGEILGSYGLVGAGRSEMIQALFGISRITRGKDNPEKGDQIVICRHVPRNADPIEKKPPCRSILAPKKDTFDAKINQIRALFYPVESSADRPSGGRCDHQRLCLALFPRYLQPV